MINKLIYLFFIFFTLESFGQDKSSDDNLELIKTIPNWAVNLKTINLGDYNSYLIQEYFDENIIGFIGDEYQMPINLNPPYTRFLYLRFENNDLFLKFISVNLLIL